MVSFVKLILALANDSVIIGSLVFILFTNISFKHYLNEIII